MPREFTAAERASVVELAERVSARLERLSEPVGAPQKLLDLALGDAFAGVRAIADRMTSDVALARVSALELDAAMRMLEQEMTRNPDRYAAWIDVPRAHVDLQETLRDLEAEARQLRSVAAGLEKATVSHAGGRVGEAISAGIKLAAPALAAVGGARVEGALPQLLSTRRGRSWSPAWRRCSVPSAGGCRRRARA